MQHNHVYWCSFVISPNNTPWYFRGSAYIRVFAKFLILGQFFKGRLKREIGLHASIYGSWICLRDIVFGSLKKLHLFRRIYCTDLNEEIVITVTEKKNSPHQAFYLYDADFRPYFHGKMRLEYMTIADSAKGQIKDFNEHIADLTGKGERKKSELEKWRWFKFL